jgi:hypothetical protein
MSTATDERSTLGWLVIRTAIVLPLLAGCMTSTAPTNGGGPSAAAPSAPEAPPPPPPTPLPPAPPFPALPRAGMIYDGAAELYASLFGFHQSRLASRYVLWDDGTFALQFSSVRWGFFQYPGRYTRADSLITFAFADGSTAGTWDATGSLRGDTLIVSYSLLMQHSDFLDGAYVRAPPTP